MAFSVKVLADSIPLHQWPTRIERGARLTTLEVTLPRIVLAEFNTHRVFSRNSASSRAIPIEKMLKKVEEDPFVPLYWGKNQRGMQAEQELLPSEQAWAETEWLEARDSAVKHAKQLLAIGVHKQITNRLLEPFLWHTIIVTATEWQNFFALRCHPDAQPEIRTAACMMRDAMARSVPEELDEGTWHMPLLPDLVNLVSDGYTTDELCRISIGRCARVSYLTHDGNRDPRADIDLCDKLQQSGHMSPFEHVARPMNCGECEAKYGIQSEFIGDQRDPKKNFCGNFRSWVSFRKTLPGEAVFSPAVL